MTTHVSLRSHGRRLAGAVLAGLLAVAIAPTGSHAEPESLPLTRDDVAYLALLGSRDLKVDRLSSRIAETELPNERAAFHPVISLETSEGKAKNLTGSVLAGATEVETETTTWSSGIRAKLLSGASASLDFTNSRLESNSQFLTINPQYQSTLALSLNQPLLRGFGPAVNTWRLKVAENNVGISRYQLQARVAAILAEAESIYWDLARATRDLAIRERALDLTRQLAKRTDELVSEGVLPETARLQSKTSVLQREADIVIAQNAQRDSMRRLQDMLNLAPGTDPTIVPLDEPQTEPRSIDVAQAVKDALARRPELPQVRLDLKNKDVLLGFARNQVLPQLNLFGSYGFNGLAGEAAATTSPTVTIPIGRRGTTTVTATVDVFPTTTTPAVGDYGTALSNLISGDFPTWKVGMNLTFPLGNVAAKSQLERAELEMQRAELAVKNVEHAIALEVERLGRQIESAYKVIIVNRAFREQANQRLSVVQDQFQLGLASLSSVVEAQRDVMTAEQEEWRSIVEYNKVLVQFDRATGSTLEKYRVEL
jgi:outer membrane protein TolC